MHFQHHAKPNCFRKDPDINMHPFFFALGKILSVEVSRGARRAQTRRHRGLWGKGSQCCQWGVTLGGGLPSGLEVVGGNRP